MSWDAVTIVTQGPGQDAILGVRRWNYGQILAREWREIIEPAGYQ